MQLNDVRLYKYPTIVFTYSHFKNNVIHLFTFRSHFKMDSCKTSNIDRTKCSNMKMIVCNTMAGVWYQLVCWVKMPLRVCVPYRNSSWVAAKRQESRTQATMIGFWSNLPNGLMSHFSNGWMRCRAKCAARIVQRPKAHSSKIMFALRFVINHLFAFFSLDWMEPIF